MNHIELSEAVTQNNYVSVRNFFDLVRNVCKKEFEVAIHCLGGLFVYINRPDYSAISEERIKFIHRIASKRGAKCVHYVDGLITVSF